MKGDPTSAAHVSSRIDEILERSLTNEREQRIAELTAELASRDARLAQSEHQIAALRADLREARAASERQGRELAGAAAQLQAALSVVRSDGRDGDPEVRSLLQEVRDAVGARELELRRQLEETVKQKSVLAGHLSRAAELLDTHNAALRDEQRLREAATSAMARAGPNVAALGRAVTELRDSTQKNLAEVARWQAEARRQIAAAVSAAARESEGNRAGRVKAERQAAELRTALDQLRSVAAESDARHAAEVTELRAECDALRARVEESEARRKAEVAEAVGARHQLEEATSSMRASFERDAKDRAREVSSLSEALKLLKTAAAEKDSAVSARSVAERSLAEVLDAFVSNVPDLATAVRSTLMTPGPARQQNAAKFIGQALQAIHTKCQRLSAENAQLLARALKAESELEGTLSDLRKSQRQSEALQRERSEQDHELSVLRVREQEASERLRRSQEVAQLMISKDREIEQLHRQLQDHSERISLEGLLRASQLDHGTERKLTHSHHHQQRKT